MSSSVSERQASRLRGSVVAMLAVGTAIAMSSPAPASADPSPALSYLSESVVNGGPCVEWRVFDPVTRTDALVRAFTNEPMGVYWDSTWSHVEYAENGAVLRLEWERDAQPWSACSLPAGVLRDWWFNPDSGCWQAVTGGGVARTWALGEPPFFRCYSELWQSDKDGASWHVLQVDTTSCGGCFFCEGWTIPDTSQVRRTGAIGLNRRVAAMSVDGWGAPPQRVPGYEAPDPALPYDWWFVPLPRAPWRGVEYRITVAPSGMQAPLAPFYLVDRRRRTKTMLATGVDPAQAMWHETLALSGDYLLMTGWITFVFDLRTGAEIFRPRGAWKGAAWVRAPRPAPEDVVGLGRLRERFR